MKILDKIAENVFFKQLVSKVNDLIDNSNGLLSTVGHLSSSVGESKNILDSHTNQLKFIEDDNAKIKDSLDSYNEQLGNLADATPLPANSVSEMADSTKLYVNISDGYIYRHNGSTFVSTGILYQATQTQYEQSMGDSETAAMSQKAVTDALQYYSGILKDKDTIVEPNVEPTAYNSDTLKVCKLAVVEVEKNYNKKYKIAETNETGDPNTLIFNHPGYYAQATPTIVTNLASTGYVEKIPIDITHAVFGEPDYNGVRWAETFRIAFYFNDSFMISPFATASALTFFNESSQQIQYSPRSGTNCYNFGIADSQSTDDTNVTIVRDEVITAEEALEQSGDSSRIYKNTINFAVTSGGKSLWGIDSNGNLVGYLASAKYLGYSFKYSTSSYHSVMLLDDYTSVYGNEWQDTNTNVALSEDDLTDTSSDYLWLGKSGEYVRGKLYRYVSSRWVMIGDVNGLQVTPASETSLGLVKAWITEENGETVLNISTEV